MGWETERATAKKTDKSTEVHGERTSSGRGYLDEEAGGAEDEGTGRAKRYEQKGIKGEKGDTGGNWV